MSTSTKPFSIVTFQDGSVAVVHSDPRTPRVLEVIAIFFEAERARDYADRENSRSTEPASEPTEAPTQRRVNQLRQHRNSARAKARCSGRSAQRWMRTNRWKRRPPSSPKLHRYRSDPFTRFCIRWKRNSSSKPPAPARRERPPSTRSCDAYMLVVLRLERLQRHRTYFRDPLLAFRVCLPRPFGFSAGSTLAGTSG